MLAPVALVRSVQNQQTSYPFLVQPIPNEVSDKDEAGAYSRQKRRRTSPQDHALLEAAYQRNSKPDKQERIELVRQVELGEKEVQVRHYMHAYTRTTQMLTCSRYGFRTAGRPS